jgi:hypothetical protein
MFNLELTLDELSELHVTLCLRKETLRHERENPNATIAAIASRQMERVVPLCYYLESMLREYHSAEA